MGLPFARVRHLNRYQEIVRVFFKYGFGDLLNVTGLLDRFPLTRKERGSGVESTPHHVRLMLEELGPTFIKLGQMMSVRPDIIPPSYVKELVLLQDSVSAVPWDQIEPLIERELGAPLDTVFTCVEQQPVGSASLAQVHRGTLLDGSEVVIKIQRPNLDQVIETDLGILYDLASLLQQRTFLGKINDLPATAEEFASTLHMELDYQREALNADRFRRNFVGIDYLHIPEIHWEYVTRRMLVMEYLGGIKIDAPDHLIAAGYDPTSVMEKAAMVIFKEVLEDGFFHGDPHPGNYMVLKDEVLGMLDFGIVGWLDHADRLSLGLLYSSIINTDVDGMAEHLIRIGSRSYPEDYESFRREVARVLRKYEGKPLRDLSLQDVMNDLLGLAFKYQLQLPSNLWMLLKTLMMLEAMGTRLAPDFDVFEVSRPYVDKLQREMMRPKTWGPILYKDFSQWVGFIRQLPLSGRRIVDKLDQGELQITIDINQADHLMSRFDRIADRLAVSLLMAAMIVGLAMLIPSFAGAWMQAVLTAAFVLVSLMGIWLLISMIRLRR